MNRANATATPDRTAFDAALVRSGGAWYAACLRITADPALAEDAVQDALLNAWRKREQFEGEAKLDTWIHRIAVNSALALVRRGQLRVFDGLADELPDESPEPADAYAEEQTVRQLDVALGRLSDLERLCFVLRHLEQYRVKEISERIGIGDGPVKQALFRALRKLRADRTVVMNHDG